MKSALRKLFANHRQRISLRLKAILFVAALQIILFLFLAYLLIGNFHELTEQMFQERNERSYNALSLALTMVKAEQNVRLFLMADAVFCALQNQKTPSGYYNIALMMKSLLKRGALVLMGLLSYVHFGLQPVIERQIAEINPEAPPENFSAQLKPLRVRRKRLATSCLFIVLTTIILGVQVYARFSPLLTISLILLAALFSWRANKTLVRFGWV